MRTGNAGRYNKSGRTGMVNTATVLCTGNNKYGNLLTSIYSVQTSGDWAKQRVADLLPENYVTIYTDYSLESDVRLILISSIQLS